MDIEDVYKIDHDNKMLTLIIYFDYNPRKNASIINSIKKFILKILPNETQKRMNYDRSILFPSKPSYIKQPISISNKGKIIKLTNRASGIVIIYEYLGLLKDWKKTVKNMNKIIKEMRVKKFNYVKSITGTKLFIGFQF